MVDIVTNVFKSGTVLSLFDPGSNGQIEIPYQTLQSIISSLLSSVKIIYQGGQGLVNAQDLQLQSLLEYEKLKTKLGALRKK